MIPERMYLHGDLYALAPNKYYCALCDSIEVQEHFYADDFHKINNQEKFNRSLSGMKKANKVFLKFNTRPKDTVNLFSAVPKKKYGKFYRWLKKQKDREDPIGDLAKDALEDNSFPFGTDSHKIVKCHLISKQACSEAIQALKEAFDEYDTKRKSLARAPLKLRFEVFKKDKYKCRICGVSAEDEGVKLEVDHIIPIARGGTDIISNLWTLCFKCNRGKGVRKL